MKNISKIINLHYSTYIYLIVCFLTGYIKQSITIFLIIIIHELGHVFFTKLFKYDIVKINIYPFGGVTIANKPINCRIIKDLLIYFGGFIFQIIMVLIVNLLGFNFYMFNYYNKTIILFNILCIFPLDGFFIIKTILEKFKSFYYIQKVMGVISFITLFIFTISFYNYSNYLILSFLLYKSIEYSKDIKYIYNRFLLERLSNNCFISKIEYNDKPNLKELKREIYHYFRYKNKIIGEKQMLEKRFDINRSF